MKASKFIAAGAAITLAVALTACGSDSSKSTAGGAGASTSSSGGTATIASKLILGGAPEFKTRPDGVPGLARVYGVTFGSYKVLDVGGPLSVAALKNGQVDAANLFTTDPSIGDNGFVILADPKSNFAAQQVVPLINKAKAADGVKEVLNTISSKLTTDILGGLMVKVVTDKVDPKAVATEWLGGLGLPTTTPAKGVSLTVGSANFQENVLLAQIYALALQGAGATVKTRLNIGSREAYIPGLKDGSIDLIPEYTGNLLRYLDKSATATEPDAVYTALQAALPSTLVVLDKSSAEDKDAIVVTKATATKYNLTSIADLAKTG